jgi:hypothetical protein
MRELHGSSGILCRLLGVARAHGDSRAPRWIFPREASPLTSDGAAWQFLAQDDIRTADRLAWELDRLGGRRRAVRLFEMARC